MKRYAFIDVQNTATTAQKMLGFVIDWVKLCDYLKNKKSCTEVYLYSGKDVGDIDTAKEFESVSTTSCCNLKTKSIFSYKNKDKKVSLLCSHCGNETIHTLDMGYTKKSNCDVEMSVDIIEKSEAETEMLLFTGDGDFEYLIRKALDRGVNKVYIYSYAEKYRKSGKRVSRFSTKLRDLIAEKSDFVFYVSVNDIKNNIKRNTPVLDT